MKRMKCKYCRAKHRVQFAVVYRNIEMCQDCAAEYAKIFDGFQNRAERKSKKNPLFKAFKEGWEAQEKENNLSKVPIPPAIQQYYIELFKQFEQDRTSDE